MLRIKHNKKDSSVSSVIGTIVLLVLVVAATGIIAVNVVTSTGTAAEKAPIVTFDTSTNPYMLYHGGGETIDLSNTKIYYQGKDITYYCKLGIGDKNELIYQNSVIEGVETHVLQVPEWTNGFALYPYSSYNSENQNDINRVKVSEISILYNTGSRYKALYTGSDYIGGIPTYVPPTQTPPVTTMWNVSLKLVINGEIIPTPYTRLVNVENDDNLYQYLKVSFVNESDGKMINGWWKDSALSNGKEWNFAKDKVNETLRQSLGVPVGEDIPLYAEVISDPYFQNGENANSISGLVDEINLWKKGTIIKVINGGTANYTICKDIPLKNQSLKFIYNSLINKDVVNFNVSDYLITTNSTWHYPDTSPVIWASLQWSTTASADKNLITVNNGTTINVYGNLIVDGNEKMKASVINVNSGAKLEIKGSLIVLNGYYDTKDTVNPSDSNTPYTNRGGGIYNAGVLSGNISVKNCVADTGGGIYNLDRLTLLKGGEISGNIANGSNKNNFGLGGGIFNSGNGAVATIYCKISDNYAKSKQTAGRNGAGGGIANEESGIVFIRSGAEISDNFANLRGGGVFTNNGASTFIGGDYAGADINNYVLISKNCAAAGGGVYTYCNVNKGNTVIYGGTTIEGNSAGNSSYKGITMNSRWDGGGIYNEGNLTFKSGIITVQNNYCGADSDNGGGGITLGKFNIDSGGQLQLPIVTYDNTEIIVKDNYAAKFGGGVYAKDNDKGGVHATFNISMNILNNTAASGGGVYVAGGTVYINKSVSNNTAKTNGGGIYVDGGTAYVNKSVSNNTATTNGGGIYLDGGTVHVNKSVSNNTAVDGGGIYINSGTANINGTVSDNRATSTANGGGGVYINVGTANINGTVSNNTAFKGAGVFVNGGTTNINGTVSDNIAENDGGGAYTAGGTLNVYGKISGNKVGINYGGGGIYAYSGKINIYGLIENNTAGNRGGGLFVFSTAVADLYNGAKIYNNTAKDGGGIIIRNNKNPGGKLNISDSVIVSNNTATTTYGGGINNEGTVIVKSYANVLMNNNTAKINGGGIYNNIGSNNNLKGTVTVESTAKISMNYNKANSGGAIAINVMSGTFTNSGKIQGIGNDEPPLNGTITGTQPVWTY